jgi:hypothetical protein
LTSAQAEPLTAEANDEGTAFRLSLWGPVFTTSSAESSAAGPSVEIRTSSFGLPAQGARLGLGAAPNRTIAFGGDLLSTKVLVRLAKRRESQAAS